MVPPEHKAGSSNLPERAIFPKRMSGLGSSDLTREAKYAFGHLCAPQSDLLLGAY